MNDTFSAIMGILLGIMIVMTGLEIAAKLGYLEAKVESECEQ